MLCPTATCIVETAMQLQREFPETPPIVILDQAMQGHEGSAPIFEGVRDDTYVDHLYSPSSFANLVRQALSPQLKVEDFLILGSTEPAREPAVEKHINAIAQQWEIIVDKFAERYRLWSAATRSQT